MLAPKYLQKASTSLMKYIQNTTLVSDEGVIKEIHCYQSLSDRYSSSDLCLITFQASRSKYGGVQPTLSFSLFALSFSSVGLDKHSFAGRR